ncbi:MAG: hypothetical protein QNJ05_09215, partial [Woeseiaceae bacterium]|nr:hypothetical protein [Woeseiaceae bacterium]
IYYADGPRSFWEMCCGDFIRADIHVEERPIDDSLLDGDYTNDRHFRKQVHAWLADIWAEKDDRLSRLAGTAEAAGHSPSDTSVS